jgi:hypothetical protein
MQKTPQNSRVDNLISNDKISKNQFKKKKEMSKKKIESIWVHSTNSSLVT